MLLRSFLACHWKRNKKEMASTTIAIARKVFLGLYFLSEDTLGAEFPLLLRERSNKHKAQVSCPLTNTSERFTWLNKQEKSILQEKSIK